MFSFAISLCHAHDVLPNRSHDLFTYYPARRTTNIGEIFLQTQNSIDIFHFFSLAIFSLRQNASSIHLKFYYITALRTHDWLLPLEGFFKLRHDILRLLVSKCKNTLLKFPIFINYFYKSWLLTNLCKVHLEKNILWTKYNCFIP